MPTFDQKQIHDIYQAESSRVLATLVRLLCDLELAEEAHQDAFFAAAEQWPRDGIPENPYAWLVSTGKFKAIDAIRKQSRGRELVEEVFATEREGTIISPQWEEYLVDDDQLRLIFYCCHPDLPLDARIALSLRQVCGMSTQEIARAYLVPLETMKKRIARAKSTIRDRDIPFEIPSAKEIANRITAVLQVIYLIFNEGYSATSGDDHIRQDLVNQAIYLSRKLVDLNATSESLGLLALLLLQDSRRDARLTSSGDIIPLEEQDRSLWDRGAICEGVQLIQTAVMHGQLGPYTLQAAIASVHAVAESVESTQWSLIVDYYDMLLSLIPSPIVELNRAIAVGMHEGPVFGLELIEMLLKNEQLSRYPAAYAARANFYERIEQRQKAILAYQQAIDCVSQNAEKRYLERKLENLI